METLDTAYSDSRGGGCRARRFAISAASFKYGDNMKKREVNLQALSRRRDRDRDREIEIERLKKSLTRLLYAGIYRSEDLRDRMMEGVWDVATYVHVHMYGGFMTSNLDAFRNRTMCVDRLVYATPASSAQCTSAFQLPLSLRSSEKSKNSKDDASSP